MAGDLTEHSVIADACAPRMLVVDDEPVIREEIVEYLREHGIQAEAVSNGADALSVIQSDSSVTVMLSDVRMPEMDGLALASSAIANGGEQNAIEVVMLTGHATISDATAAIRLRAIDFLEKPVALADLLKALMRAHAAAAARRGRWGELQALSAAEQRARDELSALRAYSERLRDQYVLAAGANADISRDTFMAVMNHELRTPLVPIIGLAELIETSPNRLAPEQMRDFAREIRLGGQRLERALSRITEYTALVTGPLPFDRAPCRPDRVLQAVRQSAAPRLAERRQTVTIGVRTLRALNTNGKRLQRLLDELLDNANRFSPPDSIIAMSVQDEGPGVAFSVTDTGAGMTNAEIGLAASAFRQVDMSLSRRVEGLGIGLPIAIRTAQGLGGTLTIDSAPQRGTNVTLHLPADCVLAPPPR